MDDSQLTPAEKEQLRQAHLGRVKFLTQIGLSEEQAHLCSDLAKEAALKAIDSIDIALSTLPSDIQPVALIMCYKILHFNLGASLRDFALESLTQMDSQDLAAIFEAGMSRGAPKDAK